MDTINETKEESQIAGRTLHQPKFATSDQKAYFRICPIPSLKGEEETFRMMKVRSEGQFNAIFYEEEDIYREQTNRWIVMMNQEDIQEKGMERK